MLSPLPLSVLAQSQQNIDPAAGAAAGAAAGILVVLTTIFLAVAVIVAVSLVVCFLLYNVQKEIPEPHQKITPASIFLLVIPLFNLVWGFFVFQRMPESFQSYFSEHGRTDVGDCGKGIGLALAIVYACSIIPCLNYVAGPATLVLLIIFIVKMYELKGKLETAAPFAEPPAAPPTP